MADFTSSTDKPDFKEIAKQEAAGWFEAKVFDQVKDKAQLALVGASSRVWAFLSKNFIDLWRVMFTTASFGLEGVDAAFGQLAALVVGSLFDVPIDTNALRDLKNNAGRKKIGRDVGHSLLKAMSAGKEPAGGGDIEPSIEPAEEYLGVMANLAIEGWVFDTFGGCIPFLHLEHLGALNEEMARVLGLGRLSRTVLRPFVNATVATPATWKINQVYRPKMLTASEAIRHNFRGHLADDELYEILTREGYGDRAIEALTYQERKYLSTADADLLVRADIWQRDDALQELRDSGHEEARATLLLQLEELKLIRKFQTELADAAVSAFADHRIDELTMNQAVHAAGLDSRTSERLVELAHQRHIVNVKHLSRGEAEQAVELGVLSESDYRDFLDSQGYGPNDALTLELMLRAKLNKAIDVAAAKAQASAERTAAKAAKTQAAAAKRDALAQLHADWSGSLGQAERLVVRGLLPVETYRRALVDRGVTAADAGELAALALQDHDAHAAAVAKRAAATAKAKSVEPSIATLERAVKLGALSREQFIADLQQRGMNDDDIAVTVGVLDAEISAAAAAQRKRDAAAAGKGVPAIALTAIESAVRRGVTTMDQYRQALIAHGYSPADVATLVGLLQSHVADDQLAAERHSAAAAKLASSHLSLASEDRAVLAGVQTLAQYSDFLFSHGFTAPDVAVLVALLEQKLAHAAAGATVKSTVAGALSAKGLSLADVEHATIAGILSVQQYADFLARHGFADDDAQILVALITPKVLAAHQAAARRGELVSAPGQRGVTLGQVQRAVLDGSSTPAYYAQFVAAQGYSADDQALLVEDLEVQLNAKATKAAAARKAGAGAGGQSITLGQAQQAVRDGVRSLDDYQAFLEGNGYGPEDVAILVAELTQQLNGPPPSP